MPNYYIAIMLSLLLLMTSVVHADELLKHRKLLQMHQFKTLERQLQNVNDQYLNGQASLRDYYWSIDTLWLERDLDAPWLWGALKAWRKHKPGSAYMNVVIGKYYTDKAYAARGADWGSEVSNKQFKQMETYFETAGHYLDQGLKSNPAIVDGHIEMLGIIRTSRAKKFNKSLVAALLNYMKTVPIEVKRKEAVWSHLLQSAIPRWGGSYTEMEGIIRSEVMKIKPAIPDRDIAALKDTIAYDQMSMSVINADYAAALEEGEKRIKANTNYAGIYLVASNAAYNLEDYQRCYQYAKKATELRPWRSFGWNRSGICAIKLQKWPEANKAYRTKLYLDGDAKYDVFQLGVTYMYLYQFDKAYALFKKAEELDPDYKKYTQKYTSYIEKEKRSSMNLVGQDITNIIGVIAYEGDVSKNKGHNH